MGIGYTVGIETQAITQDLDASDQVSFIKAGIPGIQLFSGAHSDYHRPTDTVDKIAATGLVKVAAVAKEAVVYLSGRKEPLTFKGTKPQVSSTGKPGAPKSGRRVRTGIMPDFASTGKGVKVGAVSPGSPAEKAGLKIDDIITKINGVRITTFDELVAEKEKYLPGEEVIVTVYRTSPSETEVGGQYFDLPLILGEANY